MNADLANVGLTLGFVLVIVGTAVIVSLAKFVRALAETIANAGTEVATSLAGHADTVSELARNISEGGKGGLEVVERLESAERRLEKLNQDVGSRLAAFNTRLSRMRQMEAETLEVAAGGEGEPEDLAALARQNVQELSRGQGNGGILPPGAHPRLSRLPGGR